MKEIQRVNDICKLLFKDSCKSASKKASNKDFLVLIVDSVLQQGMSYNNFVLPRINRIQNNFSHIMYISQVSTSLEDIEYMLQVKNKRKINMFQKIIELFLSENVETYSDIVNWLKNKNNFHKLLEINGFGDKTLDYMLNLFGYQHIPIDRHLFSFLKICAVHTNNYQYASSIFNNIADENDYCKISFDKEIWNYVRSIRI